MNRRKAPYDKYRERFGVLLRPSGRMEIVQLGFDGGSEELLDALEKYFGGAIEYARPSDGNAYITREGAFDEGRPRNEAATYFAGIGTYGDCIVLPKRQGGERVTWSRTESYKIKVRLECDWSWYREYSANPKKYNFKNKNAERA